MRRRKEGREGGKEGKKGVTKGTHELGHTCDMRGF